MKTFKNVVEGMGIGMVADGLFMMIKKARGGAMAPVEELAEEAAESQKVNARNADIEAQKTEMGIRQMGHLSLVLIKMSLLLILAGFSYLSCC